MIRNDDEGSNGYVFIYGKVPKKSALVRLCGTVDEYASSVGASDVVVVYRETARGTQMITWDANRKTRIVIVPNPRSCILQ